MVEEETGSGRLGLALVLIALALASAFASLLASLLQRQTRKEGGGGSILVTGADREWQASQEMR